MIKLNIDQLNAIFNIITSEQSEKTSLIEGKSEVLAPYRYLLFDSSRDVYWQHHNAITFVGFMRELDGEMFFIDARNENQEYHLQPKIT